MAKFNLTHTFAIRVFAEKLQLFQSLDINYHRSKLLTIQKPASKVVQIRAALVPVPSPDKWGGLRQEGHPA